MNAVSMNNLWTYLQGLSLTASNQLKTKIIMKKQLLLLVLILLPIVASADESGTCGNNVTYYYDYYAHTLTISGNGPMTDYSSLENLAPWNIYRDDITKIIINHGVTSIGQHAFYKLSNLTSVSLPNSITSLGFESFFGCSSLASIDLPNSIVTIDENVFCNCGLTSITIPDGVTSIGMNTFNSCRKLTSVIIPNSVTHIGLQAFDTCTSLTSITIPKNVKKIEADAFNNCTGLTAVYISDLYEWCKIQFVNTLSNPLSYAGHLYLNNKEITDLVIPNGITEVPSYAFCGCSSLSTVVIPEGVTSIGSQSFYDCRGMTNITIPNTVNNIGTYTFAYCISLGSITFPTAVKTINYGTFYWCSNLTSFIIPDDVTAIYDNAFSFCSLLKSINIPDNVTTIGNQAFDGCSSFESLVIPQKVEIIGNLAFAHCEKIADVTCLAPQVPNTGMDAFEGTPIERIILRIPASAISEYKNLYPWRTFKDIVTVEGTVVPKCETPVITYENGKLKMTCNTDEADFVTNITNSDIGQFQGSTISLTATYNISVYATKSGYDNSDAATATLCWIDATPQTGGITDGVAQIAARPVLIKTDNGLIIVEGLDARTNVSIFATDGKQVGSAISQNNVATIATSLRPGSIAIVKVGEKSVKVIIH